MIQITRAK